MIVNTISKNYCTLLKLLFVVCTAYFISVCHYVEARTSPLQRVADGCTNGCSITSPNSGYDMAASNGEYVTNLLNSQTGGTSYYTYTAYPNAMGAYDTIITLRTTDSGDDGCANRIEPVYLVVTDIRFKNPTTGTFYAMVNLRPNTNVIPVATIGARFCDSISSSGLTSFNAQLRIDYDQNGSYESTFTRNNVALGTTVNVEFPQTTLTQEGEHDVIATASGGGNSRIRGGSRVEEFKVFGLQNQCWIRGLGSDYLRRSSSDGQHQEDLAILRDSIVDCTDICEGVGGNPWDSPDGNRCFSGEARPQEALDLFGSGDPSPFRFGCYGGGGCTVANGNNTTNVASIRSGNDSGRFYWYTHGSMCYRNGQTQDGDSTDRSLGCYCRGGAAMDGVCPAKPTVTANLQYRFKDKTASVWTAWVDTPDTTPDTSDEIWVTVDEDIQFRVQCAPGGSTASLSPNTIFDLTSGGPLVGRQVLANYPAVNTKATFNGVCNFGGVTDRESTTIMRIAEDIVVSTPVSTTLSDRRRSSPTDPWTSWSPSGSRTSANATEEVQFKVTCNPTTATPSLTPAGSFTGGSVTTGRSVGASVTSGTFVGRCDNGSEFDVAQTIFTRSSAAPTLTASLQYQTSTEPVSSWIPAGWTPAGNNTAIAHDENIRFRVVCISTTGTPTTTLASNPTNIFASGGSASGGKLVTYMTTAQSSDVVGSCSDGINSVDDSTNYSRAAAPVVVVATLDPTLEVVGPKTVRKGNTVDLKWDTGHALGCTLTDIGSVGSATVVEGVDTSNPVMGTKTFKLVCGTKSATVTVNVLPAFFET